MKRRTARHLFDSFAACRVKISGLTVNRAQYYHIHGNMTLSVAGWHFVRPNGLCGRINLPLNITLGSLPSPTYHQHHRPLCVLYSLYGTQETVVLYCLSEFLVCSLAHYTGEYVCVSCSILELYVILSSLIIQSPLTVCREEHKSQNSTCSIH